MTGCRNGVGLPLFRQSNPQKQMNADPNTIGNGVLVIMGAYIALHFVAEIVLAIFTKE